MARRKDSPQKADNERNDARLSEKNNDISIKDGTDVKQHHA